MRIIRGNFRGKKLIQPLNEKTRPLRDMVKEAIFNLLEHSNKFNIKIENSKVLDLFAGTGSFGLECISRNAKKVVFFEKDIDALKVLDANLKILKYPSNCEVFDKDCFKYLNKNQNFKIKFDIIFLDPPYKELKVNEIIEKILKIKILNNNGILILHKHKKDKQKITEKLRVFENRTYGISRIIYGVKN
tara:strand:- start:231 stop:797 length:567 start_codon:yes stop_codon:yes gene_type:complete